MSETFPPQDHRRWIVRQPWPGRERLSRRLGISPLTTQLLYNRGIDDDQRAREFLNPKLSDLIEPEQLPGAAEAAKLIHRAIRDRRKIVIYGDYDVDGITATVILQQCIQLAGGQADFYLPHRLEEGYGLNPEALAQLVDAGAEMIISVDCGITANDCAELLRDRAVELIVTDHHAIGSSLPPASVLVHPRLPGSDYPNPELCAAGVAMKIAWALAKRLSPGKKVSQQFRRFLLASVSLAAMGTVADVVPLSGENRVIVHHGLRGLPHSQLPGIQALINASGLNGKRLDAYHVGFCLAPRLNAAGRLGHAKLAVELLTDDDPHRAEQIAQQLSRTNRQRQQIERDILNQAQQMLAEQGFDASKNRSIVLAGRDWHAGVIGIVAANLVRMYHRPTVLIAQQHGLCQGSGRSIEGFNIFHALQACGKWLADFGGHAMAAGLRLRPECIKGFQSDFEAYARRQLQPAELSPALHIDAELPLEQLTLQSVFELQQLRPHGHGNPPPRLLSCKLTPAGPARRMGRSGDHLSLPVRQGQTILRAVGFRMGQLQSELHGGRKFSLVYQPQINEFNGNRSVELIIEDIRFE